MSKRINKILLSRVGIIYDDDTQQTRKKFKYKKFYLMEMVQFSGSSIISIILALVILFVLIFNVVYIGGVKNALQNVGGIGGLSPGAANFIFWVDIVLIVLVVLYLIYILFVIFTTKEQRTEVKQALLKSQAGYGAALRQPTEIYLPQQA